VTHGPRAVACGSAATTLGRDALGDFENTHRREWLVTNGIGGFAAGTVGGANTRRYHGLLIAALQPPVGRTLMVAKFDIAVRYAGAGLGLGCNEYADGTVDPHGYCLLDTFGIDGQQPVWTWVIGDARLEQRVFMAHGCNTTYVTYRLLRALEPLDLELKPLCAYRDYHAQQRGPAHVATVGVQNGVEVAFAGARAFRILTEQGTCTPLGEWHWNFKHREESARGLDDVEDLYAPALIRVRLRAGESAAVILTAEPQTPMPTQPALAAEQARQARLLLSHAAARAGAAADETPGWIKTLVLAADQFVVQRRSLRDPAGSSLIAGYPWFGDWGRDTMIALPGLALTTGRFEVAADILRTFAGYVSQGMLPNRFPDAGEAPEYNTVDATLWYFVAVDEYLRSSQDRALRAELYPVLKDIVAWHLRGTRFGIGADRDGLLRSGAAGVQLTWMDAKVGDWVVTPRTGKCVEINALWFNALRIMHGLAEAANDPQAAQAYADSAAHAAASFNQRFWFDAGQHLYDVIDGTEGEADEAGSRRDASLRPNQIFAVSLRHALLPPERARAVVDVCARQLWTPVGLRSLGPGDPRYAPAYRGDQRARDGAYHQGTVWSWLLGPFAIAHWRVHGDAAAASCLLEGLRPHLREACIGQVSEIFDCAAPFVPRGCFAQAWGVAELLRAWSELHAG